MKGYVLIDLIILVNIYCSVWAQTLNNETTTQLPGNTEPLAIEMTQTPKLGDNQTEYEYTTTIQTNDIDSNKSIDLITMDNTINVTAISEKAIEVTESSTQTSDRQTIPTSNSPIDQESQAPVIDSGNSSSKSIEPNLEKEEQISDSVTTHTSILIANQPNDSTVPLQLLTANITSIFDELMNISDPANLFNNINHMTNESLNSISYITNETLAKISNMTEESYLSPIVPIESSTINSLNGHNIMTTQNSTQYSQHISSSSPEYTETTQFNELNSRQTIQTSTHKPSANITKGIEMTTIMAHIVPTSRPTVEKSAQITEMPNKSNESQTVPNHYYISTASEPIDQNIQNETRFTGIPVLVISSTKTTERPMLSQTPEVHTIPKLSPISTSSETPNFTNSIEMMQTIRQNQNQTTEKMPQNETEKQTTTTTTISPSTHPVRLSSISESKRQSKSEPMQTETKPMEIQQTSSSTVKSMITQPKQTTLLENQSTQKLSSTEATVSEKLTASPTKPYQSSSTQRESQMTEPNIGVLAANDSKSSKDSETTFQQPLTDHSLKTTQFIKPMATSIPLESNISAITVTLPNIKYISSISKEDMVNIVTITFVTKSIDIFRWVSIYDQMFRNFTCNRIDSQTNWCTIDRFVYLSPSPLVVNNHLILNFLIDDSTDNDLNNFHVFAGPLIVEALKNSTNSLETIMGMKVMSLQTNLGTMVVKPLDNSPERLAKFELLVFIFTVVMFICTALLCLAVICSCAKRKSVDMNQIQLSNAGRRHTALNGGFDLNSASTILRDENQENKLNHNVINLDGWVAPIEQVDSEKISKYDNLQDTKL